MNLINNYRFKHFRLLFKSYLQFLQTFNNIIYKLKSPENINFFFESYMIEHFFFRTLVFCSNKQSCLTKPRLGDMTGRHFFT